MLYASTTRRSPGASLLLAALAIASSIIGGCASYSIGPNTLFRSDIQTVHVPVIRSDSFRPDLGVRLTEALQQEIERRTPYKVVNDPLADSILTCRFIGDSKEVLTETATDEPRALDVRTWAEASWIDRNGRILMQNRLLPPGELSLAFFNASRFVPEAGQSVETALTEAIDELAIAIVDQMEVRW